MSVVIKNIKLPVEYDDAEALLYAEKKYGCKCKILKKSVDARHKNQLFFVFSFIADRYDKKILKYKNVEKLIVTEEKLSFGDTVMDFRPVIVGAGPAGLFCGYTLAKYGYQPIIIERGEDIDKRTRTVETFFKTKVLDKNSNVQFGEGGAGAFSDGKLTTRIHDPLAKEVMDLLAEYSGVEGTLAKPHIGTDRLKTAVKKLREDIIAMGGSFLFSTTVTDIIIKKGQIEGVLLHNADKISTKVVIMATGHSAKDVYQFLHAAGADMAPKDFSVGARIEHFREDINIAQYGAFHNHPHLSAADYQVWHACRSGRTAYSFCMCPGGLVIPSQSEENTIVVNGMSAFARNEINSNAAICVGISKNDCGSGLFDGLSFIEQIEKNAFMKTGKNYKAPFTTTKELTGIVPCKNLPDPSYAHGVAEVDFLEIYPDFIVETIQEGLLAFEKRLNGFVTNGGILTGVETRTSAPLRILRNQNYENNSIVGLYPCGEGAGYAGGIVSSAVDGMKVARMIFKKYRSQ